MEEKKMTKRDYFVEIQEVLTNAGENDLADVIAHEIELLDNKAAKNKERAAARKIAGDELRDTISSVLTDDPQTADEILEQIDGEDVTKSKIIARLTQLVKLGEASKEEVKSENGKRMAYKRA